MYTASKVDGNHTSLLVMSICSYAAGGGGCCCINGLVSYFRRRARLSAEEAKYRDLAQLDATGATGQLKSVELQGVEEVNPLVSVEVRT